MLNLYHSNRENIDVLLLLLILEAALAMKWKHYLWHVIWLPCYASSIECTKNRRTIDENKRFVTKEK